MTSLSIPARANNGKDFYHRRPTFSPVSATHDAICFNHYKVAIGPVKVLANLDAAL